MKTLVIGIGILFSFNSARAAHIAFRLVNNDMKIKEELSFNENKPVVFSRYDNANKPYPLF